MQRDKIDLRMQADAVTRDTSFELSGVQYRLRFDFSALYQFYLHFHVNPVIEHVGADPSRIAGLLYVALLCHHPEIEASTVTSWFNSGPMALALTELAFSALRAQMPDPDPDAAAPDPLTA